MKNLILLISMLFCLNLAAQTDTSQRKSWVSATMKLGSFNGSLFSTDEIRGFALNPVVSFGKTVKLNVGCLRVNLDTIGRGLDSIRPTFDRFQLGLSFEQQIPNTSLYVGAAYDLSAPRANARASNMVSIRMGYLISENTDFSVQSSRIFAGLPDPSGNVILFGFRVML